MLTNMAREGKEGSQGKGKQLHEPSTGVVLDCLRSVPDYSHLLKKALPTLREAWHMADPNTSLKRKDVFFHLAAGLGPKGAELSFRPHQISDVILGKTSNAPCLSV